ncbi:response regulator [Photobacterium frigidiphilum]|uniref:response regulator n=1 Tax=Photobacterium frigidiphilum TaxID=264736 RepID=UPI003D12D54C
MELERFTKSVIFKKIAVIMGVVMMLSFMATLYITYTSNTHRISKDIQTVMNSSSQLIIDATIFDNTEKSIELNRLFSNYEEIGSVAIYDLNGNLVHFYTNYTMHATTDYHLDYKEGISVYKGDYKLSYSLDFNNLPILKYVVFYFSSNVIKAIYTQLILLLFPFVVLLVYTLYYMYREVTLPLNHLIGELPKVGTGQVSVNSVKKLEGEVTVLAKEIDYADKCIYLHSLKMEALNKKLEARTLALNKALTIKGDFMANMSHEIRTPMNGVLGFIQCLEAQPLDDEAKRQVSYIKESAQSLLSIINEILDYSKLESGNVTLNYTPIAIAELVRSSLMTIKYEAEKKSIVLDNNIDPNLASHYLGDECRIKQILTNLLGNAVKFTEHGKVTLSVTLINKTKNGTCIHFTVKDTGIGIDLEKQIIIFDSYTQADGSISRKYGGTGLGLSISNSLCKLMGSKLEVKSQPSVETEFYFDVQLDEVAVPIVVKKRSPNFNLSNYADKHILVAEDSMVNQQLVKALLKTLGLTTISMVSDGIQAIDFIKQQKVDLVLMDCQMPNMGGLEATKAIRVLNLSHQPSIIALTANVLDDEKTRCLTAGMNDYIPKPIERAKLFSSLKNAFENGYKQ